MHRSAEIVVRAASATLVAAPARRRAPHRGIRAERGRILVPTSLDPPGMDGAVCSHGATGLTPAAAAEVR